MSARDLLLGQGKSILISRKNVCWGGAPAWPCLNAWWFWRQWCREIKGYSLSVVQHTASCQIKSKSNTTQSKAAPQSYPSIIRCKNGRQVYVGPTSIIHAFIRKTCRGEMNRSFNFFAFISLLGRWRNPPHHYLVHRTQTQTHNNTLMKLRDSSIFWPAGSNPGRTDVVSAPQDKLLYRRQSRRTIKSLKMTTMMIKHGWSKSSLMYYYRCLGEGLRLSPTSARDRISVIMWREGSAILCGFISKCMSALTGVLSKWRGTEGHKSFLRETSHSCYTQCNDCESFYSTFCGPSFYGVRVTLSLSSIADINL